MWMRELSVHGVTLDLTSRQPIVLLKTLEGETFLPIWVGHPEAAAILMQLQEAEPPRPLTHDLACSFVASLDAAVVRVTVTELRDNTFIASITLSRNGAEVEVDSRTSDAIAIALRTGAQIYAADDVIEESGLEFEGDAPELGRLIDPEQEVDDFRRFLDTVSADEFKREGDAPQA